MNENYVAIPLSNLKKVIVGLINSAKSKDLRESKIELIKALFNLGNMINISKEDLWNKIIHK